MLVILIWKGHAIPSTSALYQVVLIAIKTLDGLTRFQFTGPVYSRAMHEIRLLPVVLMITVLKPVSSLTSVQYKLSNGSYLIPVFRISSSRIRGFVESLFARNTPAVKGRWQIEAEIE